MNDLMNDSHHDNHHPHHHQPHHHHHHKFEPNDDQVIHSNLNQSINSSQLSFEPFQSEDDLQFKVCS